MELGEAITTAIEYEGRVHKTYAQAREMARDEVGKRVFTTLMKEEQGHLSYLKERLKEWQDTGSITQAELATAIPSRAAIDQGVASLRAKVADPDAGKFDAELEMLRRALQVEVETSTFYEEMVRTLDAEGRQLFERFVEIEHGHQAIVQAEIDCLSGAGFWFDTPEFSLEMERS